MTFGEYIRIAISYPMEVLGTYVRSFIALLNPISGAGYIYTRTNMRFVYTIFNYSLLFVSFVFISKYIFSKSYKQLSADFASLPQEISENILKESKQHLASGGKFITFQYTLLRMGFFENHFDEITITHEIRNVPPAYVLSCSISKQLRKRA